MSRKTKSLPSSGRRLASFHMNIGEAPRVERLLPLVCGVCGKRGKYDVGTVVIDPIAARSSASDCIEKSIGFSGYFRCRKCDAGGPWLPTPQSKIIIMALMMEITSGAEGVPLNLGVMATFDKRPFRYTTEAEAHLKSLIELEPGRSFLWVRLGNLYSHSGLTDRAESAYLRAIELDSKDIEAHSMYGQLLVETDRYLAAVPHWHAVLKNVREASHVRKELRKQLVRGSIEMLFDAYVKTKGGIEFLPLEGPAEFAKQKKDEPVILDLRTFELGTENGINQLCDMFLELPRRGLRERLGIRKERNPDRAHDEGAAPIHRQQPLVGRNAPCICGSGRKYKKCCER